MRFLDQGGTAGASGASSGTVSALLDALEEEQGLSDRGGAKGGKRSAGAAQIGGPIINSEPQVWRNPNWFHTGVQNMESGEGRFSLAFCL